MLQNLFCFALDSREAERRRRKRRKKERENAVDGKEIENQIRRRVTWNIRGWKKVGWTGTTQRGKS